jgi:hypothetical protein
MGQGSWAHGILKDAAWKNFSMFKFKVVHTEEIKCYNQDLWHALLHDDAFHHKVSNYFFIKNCTD